MPTQYHVYSNGGSGPIDYAHPIATTSGSSVQTQGLAPGNWKFGVRAFDDITGMEEQNIDAIAIRIGANSSDETGIPSAPVGLLVVGKAGGSARLHWSYPSVANRPIGFRAYAGTGSPDYSAPLATVLAGDVGLNPSYSCLLTGLTDGTTYAIGVRAYNASGEEQNTTSVSATARSIGPSAVDAFTITATT